ncbi:MAG: hypothetical protein JWP66_1861 [Naasia sp.]|nr:hypothetical protein [Naasia sp.]
MNPDTFAARSAAAHDWSAVDLFEIDDAALALLDAGIAEFDAGPAPLL